MSDSPVATESTSKYITRSVSLFPTQDNAVSEFAKTSGLENYSAALRMIINQWLRYEVEKHQLLAERRGTVETM